ncbi:MAG TPA: alkane 1-monooxygenase [Sediminibacterium sp.]|nr:alkane 1-monooxygenase [Sediminibacterium sp.]
MKSIKFSLAYITPLIVLFSLYTENLGSFAAVLMLFVLIPLIELFTKGSTTNLSKIEEELEKENKVYDWMLYGLVPFQYLILVYFLIQVSNEGLLLSYKIGATTAYGMACGILGINAAHELGHRPTKHEQFMSKLLLLSTLYMHFFIEHNRGHHKNVSTDEDPASSRFGETVYAFYLRTILGSYSSAWHIESERLKKKNLSFWSIKNEMLVYQLVQLILIVLIGIIFGLNTLLFFIVGAFIGILLLETVNYIEHYGLKRKKKGDTYERTMPIHSWNSNHPLGRLILLELSRHSDHHYMASRKYQVLRHFDESPQMPTGYPGMLLLSLVPPLWFKVMHQRIDRYKQTQMGVELG